MSEVNCPQCGSEYTNIGLHWHRSECSYPSFTQRQHEIITGILMGDGSINAKEGRKPYFKLTNKKKTFVQYIRDQFGILATDVKTEKMFTSYSGEITMYRVATRCLPELEEYADWYKPDGKRYPHDLELTPLIAKMWYVCDGGLNKSESQRYTVQIACKDQKDRGDKIIELFDEVGFTAKWAGSQIYLRASDSQDFLEWIGDPVPGYEYKWDSNDNIENTFDRPQNNPWKDKDRMYDLYVDKNMSMNDIAEELECSFHTVNCWLHKHDIDVEDKHVTY
jgi:hypothetical protein